MAVRKELLDILICPVCKGELTLKEDQSGLKCNECKRVYPIRDDLPIMMEEISRQSSRRNRQHERVGAIAPRSARGGYPSA